MKLTGILLISVLFLQQAFCQSTTNKTLSKDYYLQKSKKQNKEGGVLLGVGAAAIGTGFIVINKEHFLDFSGEGLVGLGLINCLASVPFFILSGSNARKAASINFTLSSVLVAQQNNLFTKKQPSITLKIAF